MSNFKVSLRHGGSVDVQADRVVVRDYGVEFMRLQPEEGERPGVYDTICFVPIEQLFFVKREDPVNVVGN